MSSITTHTIDFNLLARQLIPDARDRGKLPLVLSHIAQTIASLLQTDAYVVAGTHPITEVTQYIFTASRDLTINADKCQRVVDVSSIITEIEQRNVYHLTNQKPIVEILQLDPHLQTMQSSTILPLRLRPDARPFGFLLLMFKQAQIFDQESDKILAFCTQQASQILQETWLLYRYKEVARIGQEINQEISTPEKLFEKLRGLVIDILDAHRSFYLALYDPTTNTRDIYITDEGRTIYLPGRLLGGASGFVLERKQSVMISCWSQETATSTFQILPIEGTEPKESFIFVPLLLHDTPLGVISIQHPLPNVYTEEDLAIVQVLANHIAQAINNMRLYNNLSQLNQTGQFLTRIFASEGVLPAAIEKIQDATKADIVILAPLSSAKEHHLLQQSMTTGIISHATELSRAFMQWIEETIQPLLQYGDSFFLPDLEIPGEMSLPAPVLVFLEHETVKSLAIVPLIVEKEAIGALCLLFRKIQCFDNTQKWFVQGLAHFTAITIRNARTFDSLLHRRVKELETVQHIEQALNGSLNLDAILDTLLHLIRESVPAEGAAILLYNQTTQILDARVARKPQEPTHRFLEFPNNYPEGICGWVYQNKQSVRVNNVHSEEPWCRLYRKVDPATLSEVDIPLITGDTVIGVLNVESSKEGAFRKEDQIFLETLAAQAVQAITKAQAYEREKRLAQESQVLYDISKELTGQLDLPTVFQLILQKALDLTRSRTGVLMLLNADNQQLEMAAEHGVLPDKRWSSHSMDKGVVGHVARTREALNIDPSIPPWNEVFLHYIPGTRSELALPMIRGNTMLGVINIESTEINAFSERDVHLLEGLADLAVIALHNAELYHSVEKETQHFELLYQASRELSEISTPDQLEQAYDLVTRLAEEYSQGYVVLRRYDESNSDLLLIRASERAVPFEVHLAVEEGINGYVTRHRHTIVVPDTKHLPPEISTITVNDPLLRSIIVIPIQFEDHYYGTLALTHIQGGFFSGIDTRIYDGLAQQLATTIYRLDAATARIEADKRARAAEEIMLIGQSAIELTHRLGNDLGLVASYIGDVRRKLLTYNIQDEFINRKLNDTVQAVRTVLDLSGNLKNLMASSGEALAGDRVYVSPKVLLHRACESCKKKLSVLVQIEMNEDVSDVFILEKSVQDILYNLVNNAIEAMPQGGKLTLRAYNENNYTAIEVCDTGMGISEQIRKKIFSLFFSTKGNSGFGLWSARQNALRNHGDLLVESKIGEGTTFKLLLPRK
ncbi:MAG TPA: GAF domain-containing protein [Ktedonobacteraceae bacterium]|nr:GAF domain-containing protein [Ktedonobacteraceae bacterium]